MKLLFPISIAVLLAVLAAPSVAATVYVRDTLYVPLRGGQTAEHRILHKGLKSGTPLELLQQNDESGYSQVQLQDGMVGWIQTQYLIDTPIAADLLTSAQAELSAARSQQQQGLLRIQTLQAERDRLAAALQASETKSTQTSRELARITDLSANAIKIEGQNRELVIERESLESQINDLISANEELQDASAQEWFLRGGGMALAAMLLGLWVGRRIYLRRGSDWH